MMIPEKARELGRKFEKGYLYYVNTKGDVCRVKMKIGNMSSDETSSGEKTSPIIIKCDYIVEPGYRYFLSRGDIYRVTEEEWQKL